MPECELPRRFDPRIIHEVNLRICDITVRFDDLIDTMPARFLCECGCAEVVEMTAPEYDAAGIALLPGHSIHRR